MADNIIDITVKEFLKDSSRRALLDISKNIDNIRTQYVQTPSSADFVSVPQIVSEFMKSTDSIASKDEIKQLNAKMDILSQPRYKKCTYDINRTDLNNKTSYPVTKIYGMGKITELSILTSTKPKLEIYVDNRHMFDLSITPFDDLARISSFSKDITADIIPPNYVVSIRNIGFKKLFRTDVYFDTPSNILSIYCKYDLCEVI
jgi:hypothetical protein